MVDNGNIKENHNMLAGHGGSLWPGLLCCLDYCSLLMQPQPQSCTGLNNLDLLLSLGAAGALRSVKVLRDDQ